MICFPNAKINLGLNIVSKRDDGYHNLETIFYPVPVKDALEIIVKDGQSDDCFYLDGLDVGTPCSDNLVMRALKIMRARYQFPILDVHLLKKIPFGAGIGGGSADAAFMLHLVNDTFNLGATKGELAAMALELGADCPFFIYNKPMYAEGLGEKLESVSLSLSGYSILLVKPDIHISTKDAFARIKPSKPSKSLKEIIKLPIGEWRNEMINDFESSIFPRYPEIREIKELLYAKGAIYASMTGSGSSVYGIFPKNIEEAIDCSELKALTLLLKI